MPRLTRTQKYAELRDSLANDKESSLQTKDLSNFEDRLNSITEILSAQSIKQEEQAPVEEKPVYQNPVYQTPIEEYKNENDPKYTWTEFKETPVEELVETFKNSELEKQIREMSAQADAWKNENQLSQESIAPSPVAPEVEEVSIASVAQPKPMIDVPVYEMPVDEVPVTREPEENIRPLIQETPYAENYSAADYTPDYTPSYQTPAAETVQVPEQEAVSENREEPEYPGYYKPQPEIEELYKAAEELEQRAAQIEETLPSVEEVQPVQEIITPDDFLVEETPVAQQVQEPVEEAEPVRETEAADENQFPRMPIEDFVDNHVVDHETQTNSYLTDTMDEVSRYNQRNGDLTISELTSSMVNEVRHPEEETPVASFVEEDIYAPMKEDVEETIPAAEEQTAVEETVSEPVQEYEMEPLGGYEEAFIEAEEIVNETAEEEEPVTVPVQAEPEIEEAEPIKEEHPVKAITQEEENKEEVVEIKNLKELEAEPVRDTVSNTIPFVVATEEDEEEIEDDDEDSSNTILNIILIVLIIVLVAVLGLIVFYILRTKGVI